MLKKILAMMLLFSMVFALVACAGEVGPQGEKGDKGDKGEKGDKGDGITLVSLSKTESAGLVDTWTMTFSDGSSMSFDITNGAVGETGPQGVKGDTGAAGATPFIGENGNWFIGTSDTGVKAQGTNGTQGTAGANGVTPHIGDNGNWFIGSEDTGVPATGPQGPAGSGGSGGAGTPGEPGTTPHIGDNGNWYLGTLDTGVKAAGTKGDKGDNGVTPHIGDNGNWFIGDEDTGIYAGGQSEAKMTSIVFDSSTTLSRTYKINFDDESAIPFTVMTSGDAKSEVVSAHETAATVGYSRPLDAFVLASAELAYKTLVSAGSPLEGKTLAVAMGALMSKYNTYFSCIHEVELSSTASLDAFADMIYETPRRLDIKPEGTAFETNSVIAPVIPGDIIKVTTVMYAENWLTVPYIGWYDVEDNLVSAIYVGDKTQYTVPDDIYGVRVGVYKSAAHDYRLEIFSTSFNFAATASLTVAAVNQLANGSSGGGAELPKTMVSAVLGAVSITTEKDSLTAGSYLYLTEKENTVQLNKIITFKADLFAPLSAGESILVGHGKTEAQASWIEITSTEIIVWYSDWGTPTERTRFTHNLTISDYILVTIDNTSGAPNATISITTSSGSYKSGAARWDGRRGRVFAYSEDVDMSALTLRWLCDAYSQKVWMYGDSYFDTGYGERWPYYLKQAGFDNFMLSGYSGMGTAAALEQFKVDVSYGTPQYAVWCMGMNNPDTDAATVNADWLAATTEFLEICATEGITPILATIPSTPGGTNGNGRFHYAKIAWVKESGYRYIDFAHAVGGDRTDPALVDGVNTTGAYWYYDMLHADGVHPAAKGAEALYYQFLTDFPEITKLK